MKTEVCGEIRLCDFEPTPANFKTEFIVGLKRYPKVLPCKLFCDEHGSRLFVPDKARCTERHRVERETKNMKTKQIKLPGPDHPISIERNPDHVVVSVAVCAIADTRNALTLREADYPAVQYIPRADVDLSELERTDHATYCPYKGDCNYYSIPVGGKKSVNAVWTYENPYSAVAQIKRHVAFYPDRVDEIVER